MQITTTFWRGIWLRLRLVNHLQHSLKIWSFGQWGYKLPSSLPVIRFDHIAKVHPVMAENTPGAMYNSAYALTLGHPAFGTVASAADVVHFAHHFTPQGPRIHSEAAIRTMTIDQTGGVTGQHVTLSGFSPQTNIPWGIGWWLQTAKLCRLPYVTLHRAFCIWPWWGKRLPISG